MKKVVMIGIGVLFLNTLLAGEWPVRGYRETPLENYPDFAVKFLDQYPDYKGNTSQIDKLFISKEYLDIQGMFIGQPDKTIIASFYWHKECTQEEFNERLQPILTFLKENYAGETMSNVSIQEAIRGFLKVKKRR